MIQSQLQQRMAEAGASVCLMLAATLFFQTLRFRTEGNFEMDGRRRHLKSKEIPGFLIQGKDQEGFKERYINDFIGRGVFTTKKFSKGDFLLEYKGELVSEDEGYQREESYEAELGSFLFFFNLDATFSDGLGRLVNDDPLHQANCVMKKIKGGNKVYLVLCAIKNIEKGEELCNDSGVKDLPWQQLKDKVHGVKDGKVERKVQPNKDNSSANKCLHTEDISPVNQTNDCLSADSLETALKVPAKKSNPLKKRSSCKIPNKQNKDRGMSQSKTFKVSAKMSASQKKCKTRKNPAKENGDCAIPKSKNLTGSDLSDMESELSDESNDNGATGALKVLAKKSNPPKKCISRKIPDKENEDRGMPQSKKSVSRVSWTEEEKDAVFKHLSSFVRQGRFPGKRDCENCISKSNGALERRDWRAVKYFVKNQVDKRKRVLAPKNSYVITSEIRKIPCSHYPYCQP